MLHLPFLRRQNSDDLALGRLRRFPISPLFRVTASARTAHLYVIGMSGKGKSKLLEWCLYQNITAGRGCGLIDPHSLLVDDLLRLLVTKGVLADPDIRHRLIYVDPARTDYVIPFNVLATQAEHPYDIAAIVLEAFRRTWSECLKEAPHFPNVVTAALIVLIENGLTLMHMPRLLTNADFREQCLDRVTDASIVEFFHDRYDRWGREAPVMRESTLRAVLFSARAVGAVGGPPALPTGPPGDRGQPGWAGGVVEDNDHPTLYCHRGAGGEGPPREPDQVWHTLCRGRAECAGNPGRGQSGAII